MKAKIGFLYSDVLLGIIFMIAAISLSVTLTPISSRFSITT